MENIVEKSFDRKTKILNWFKSPYNLLFTLLLLLGIVVRIYFFMQTVNQPIWYDEAEYMSGGMHFAYDFPYQISIKRPILFHFLISLLMRLDFTETMIKFTLSTLPGILIIWITFLLVKEMYDEKTALISSFMMAFFWMILFYSMRVMTDQIGLFFGIFAFYCFWKGYFKKQYPKLIWLIGPLVSLALLTRLISVIFGLIILVFLIFTEHLKFIKNKNLWISFLLAGLVLAPFLIWNYSYHGQWLGFIASNVGGEGQGGSSSYPIGWNLLNFVPHFLEKIFYIFFFIGLLTFFNMFLQLDYIFKNKDNKHSADFFIFLTLIFVLAFFIFYFRVAEDRWMIAMALPLFVIASKGILFISNLIEKYSSKTIAVLFIIAVLIGGVYFHLKFTDDLIESKKESYLQVKQAGIWIKENSAPEDIVFTNSITQNIYYSQRETYVLGKNETTFLEKVAEKKPRYLIVSSFEQYPDWALNPSEELASKISPVQAFFFDAQKKQPAAIIYKFK